MTSLPLWAVFASTVVLVLGSIRLGYFLAQWQLRRRPAAAEDGPVGSVVGAVLGLLAFLLAFTFGSASSRFDERKHLLIEEVNAIGTAFLRTDLLAQPTADECKDLLRRYVAGRASIPEDPEAMAQVLASATKLQEQLWKLAMSLPGTDLPPPITALFVAALNDVFDLHTSRTIVALQHRIPTTIWLGLIAMVALAMATVGYQFGVKSRSNAHVYWLLGLSFSAAVTLIADLDKVTVGTLRVDQQPMVELQQQLGPARR